MKDIRNGEFQFPLYMLLCTQFVRGSLIIIVLFPIAKFARTQDFPEGSIALAAGIVRHWWYIFRDAGQLAFIPIWLGLALVVGFAVAPVERLFSLAFLWPLNRALTLRRRRKRGSARQCDAPFFTPLNDARPEYVAFMDWLFDRREDKAHWEWELSHYFIYWNIPFVLFAAAAVAHGRPGSWTALYVLDGTFTVFALQRSRIMQAVQRHFYLSWNGKSSFVTKSL